MEKQKKVKPLNAKYVQRQHKKSNKITRKSCPAGVHRGSQLWHWCHRHVAKPK